MRRILRALAALALTACAQPEQALIASPHEKQITVSIDTGFSLYQRAEVLMAVSDWNDALRGVAHFQIVEGQAQVPVIEQRGNAGTPRQAAVTLKGKGSDAVVIVFVDKLGSCPLHSVMIHELGHSIGLKHTHAGLMAPICGPDTDHIDHDSAALAREKVKS